MVVTDARNAGGRAALRVKNMLDFGHVQLEVACETSKWNVE